MLKQFFFMAALSLSPICIQASSTSKKKIMIFICNGGYGHRAACSAICPLLEKEYELQIVNPFTEVISELDFAKKITGQNCDEFYNSLLRNGWTRFINFYSRYFAPGDITRNKKKITKLFDEFIQQHKPDAILSLIPVVNLPASNAAAKYNIPYTIVTLDHNTTMWQIGMNKCAHKNILTTVHNNQVKEAFCSKITTIPPQQIMPIGFPVRPDFLTSKDRNTIKKEWDIPDNKKVIMLMIGSVGGTKTIQYVKELSKRDDHLHILVCIGSNEKLRKKLQPIIEKAKTTSFSLIPFTQKIADLMAASDLIVTKPGPGIIEESIQMQVPLLLDVTSPILFWEQDNVTFALNKGFAHKVKKVKQINKLITEQMSNEKYRKLKSCLASYKSTFNQQLINLIHQQCPPAKSRHFT